MTQIINEKINNIYYFIMCGMNRNFRVSDSTERITNSTIHVDVLSNT